MKVGAPTVTVGMPMYSAAIEEPVSLVVHRPQPQFPLITASISSSLSLSWNARVWLLWPNTE